MKLAIISGGSKGLGAALADHYRQLQFTIVELSRSGQTADSVQLDLAQPAEVLTAVPPLFAQLSQQSWAEVIFFNNAGVISPIGSVADKESDAIIANIHVNFTSAILLIREFVAAFQAMPCPKTIVNISSGAALSPIYGWSLYCGAKAGIEHFVRTVAAEQKEQPQPITAVNIGPGIIDTDMQATIRCSSDTDFPGVECFRGFKEAGALRSPLVVAAAIGRILAANPETGSRHDIANYV